MIIRKKKTKDQLTRAAAAVITLSVTAIIYQKVPIFGSVDDLTKAIEVNWGIFVPLDLINKILLTIIILSAIFYGFLTYFFEETLLPNSLSTSPVQNLDGLRRLYSKLEEYSGTQILSIEQRFEILKKNEICFQEVSFISSEGDKSVVGYIILYPLVSSAADAVRDGNLRGYQVGPDHIAAKGEKVSACYVAFAWSRDSAMHYKKIAAFILHETQSIIRTLNYNESNFEIYTRPTTSDALRLVTRRGFVNLDDDEVPAINRICYLSNEKFQQTTSRKKRNEKTIQ